MPERRPQQAEHPRDPALKRKAVFVESAPKWDHPKAARNRGTPMPLKARKAKPKKRG